MSVISPQQNESAGSKPPSSPPSVLCPSPVTSSPLAPSSGNFEQIRLQQLYTLALADRMRFLHPLLNPYGPRGGGAPPPPPPLNPAPSQPPAPPPPTPPNPHAPASSPADLFLAYKGLDPRFFGRLGPEEPKPQQSYIGLIAMAILSSSEQKLVLADIYQYILDNFSYFRHRGPGWRNSIRHNLSLNDCFIKAGRAANGKGHYWAIHTACIEDFKKGDFRRRKAQRKVRRYMGLAVDEEDSPSPPPPPCVPPLLGHGWPPLPLRLPLPPHHPHPPFLPTPPTSGHGLPPPPPLPFLPAVPQPQITPPSSVGEKSATPTSGTPPATSVVRAKRLFDVASLLGHSKKEASKENNELKEDDPEKLDVVADDNDEQGNQDTNEDDNNSENEGSVTKEDHHRKSAENHVTSGKDEEEVNSWRSASPPAALPPAHQYLARYYQLVQQQQQNSAQAAAAALAAAAAAAASSSGLTGSKHEPQNGTPPPGSPPPMPNFAHELLNRRTL